MSKLFSKINYSLPLIHRYVVTVLPIAIVTGPFLADLFCIISSMLFIYFSFLKKEFHYYYQKLFILFIAWCVYLIITSILSNDPLFSLESSLFHFRFGLFALSILYIFNNDSKISKYMTICFVSLFIFILIDGYYQYITGFNLFGFEYSHQYGRLSGIFGDKWIIGNFLSRTFPIIFALLIMNFKYSRKVALLMIFILITTDILIFLSGERSAFISLLLGSILIIILSNKWKRFRAFSLIFSLLVIILISISNNNIKNRMIDHTINQTNIFGSNYIPDHELLFKSAYYMFLDSPIIGNGTKMFRKLCGDEKYYFEYEAYNSCSTHPHNTYFQLLAETGLLGTIPVILVLSFIFYLFLRHFFMKVYSIKPYLSDVQICLYVGIVISLWPLNTHMNFFGNWLNVIYFLPIGILLHTYNINRSNINN
ncbi:O-antigen ligase family protein [Pelagibacterales bacterium]|nr:O-antigen ligase family protein [Pelagibacterales bacterium]